MRSRGGKAARLVVERLSPGGWIPPWLYYQHVARYQWVSTLAKGCRVIDAACGIGYGATIMLNNGAEDITCFDLSTDAIQKARELHLRDGLRFAVADVTHLPVKDHTYDVFVAMETIEHVENDRAFLTEVFRVLKPQGKFICSTPNRAVTNPGTSLADRPFNPYHIREYSRIELERILGEYFSAIKCACQTPYGLWYGRMLAAIGRSRPRLAVRLHQIRKVLGIPWETLERHRPVPITPDCEPEVLIAVCTR